MSYTRNEIIEKIKELADEKYKKFQGNLCPNTDNIFGVRVPKLRKLARELSNEDWQANYDALKHDSYEEIMLKGIMIGYAKTDLNTRLTYLDKYVPEIENWAECDTTVSSLKFINKNKEKTWLHTQEYLKSDKEFVVRFAIVIILNYYIEDEYIDKVIKLLDEVKCQDMYYVKMAVAWAISYVYIKYPKRGMKYLKNKNQLDDWTYNKSIQKIIESYQVSDKEKDLLKKLKR